VSADTRSGVFNARDTVMLDTLANAATSWIVSLRDSGKGRMGMHKF
jgi:hypothetical protein